MDNALLVHAAIAYGYASLDVAHPASQLAVNQLQTHLPYHAHPFLPLIYSHDDPRTLRLRPRRARRLAYRAVEPAVLAHRVCDGWPARVAAGEGGGS